MEQIIEILLAVFACGGILALLWFIAGILLLPVCRRGDRAVAIIPLCEGCEALENTVRGILWLNESGAARMEIILVSDGTEGETVKLAGLLSSEKEEITVCGSEELPMLLKNMAEKHT